MQGSGTRCSRGREEFARRIRTRRAGGERQPERAGKRRFAARRAPRFRRANPCPTSGRGPGRSPLWTPVGVVGSGNGVQNTSRVNFPDCDGDPQHVRAAAPDRSSHHHSCGIRCSSRRIGIGSSPSTIRSGVPELPEVKEFGADIAAEQAFRGVDRTLVAAGSAGRFSTASVPDAVAPTILTGTEVHLSAGAGICPCRRSASPLGQDFSPTTAEAFTAGPHAFAGRDAAFRPGAGGDSRAPESRKRGEIPLASSEGLSGWDFPVGTCPDEDRDEHHRRRSAVRSHRGGAARAPPPPNRLPAEPAAR